MSKEWWLFFLFSTYLGYKMKTVAMSDSKSKVSAVDAGLMLGSVGFFLFNLGKAALRGDQESADALAKSD